MREGRYPQHCTKQKRVQVWRRQNFCKIFLQSKFGFRKFQSFPNHGGEGVLIKSLHFIFAHPEQKIKKNPGEEKFRAAF
jgi:hypothetical protein